VAAYKQPAVVFIDEVDSLLCARSSEENEATRRIKVTNTFMCVCVYINTMFTVFMCVRAVYVCLKYWYKKVLRVVLYFTSHYALY